MAHHLDHTIALLRRTPATLNALLRDLPEEWVLGNEGEGTWNARDIVGHLIYADRHDWLPRMNWIFMKGERAPFPPFDREGHKRESEGKSLGQLLDEFASVREEQLRQLDARKLQAGDFQSRGLHPVLGPVTVSELLATWPAHDLNHLHQLSRVMSHPYREYVGPFSRFLGVMQCNAHGA